MQRVPNASISNMVMLARRQPNGEWWSSTYDGDTRKLWFFSPDAQPRFGDTNAIMAAFLLDSDEPFPEHKTGWWAAIVGIRSA